MISDFIRMMDEFKPGSFKKIYGLTWIFVSAGLLLYAMFVFIAFQTQAKSFVYYLLQNIGIFLFVASLMTGYLSVSVITLGSGSGSSMLATMKTAMKKSPYMLAVSLAGVLLVTIMVAVEGLVAFLGSIDKAGPILLGLLTIPFFIANFGCIVFALCVILAAAPCAVNSTDMRGFIGGMKRLYRERLLSILVYAVISLSVLMLGIMVLYYFSGHAIGITRAVQFNIDKFYPKFLAGTGMKSFFTDIAVKIPPQNEMIGIMGSYQLGLMTYGQLITVIVTASYAVLFTLLIAFPLSVYFRVTSLFFGRIAGK
ncbi:MAG TPA: hypothetical protein P5346_10195 [Spirochaetota bacterium]|nr:hypothetical protein [Spirochaetota bacterium]